MKSFYQKINSTITKVPKQLLALALVVAFGTVSSAAVMAWGPGRDTFTFEKPADHVTFNSVTNNPHHGDERNFVQIKAASAPNSSYGEEVALQPGKEYEVYVYFHNDAASNYNDANSNYKGIARNAKMRVQMPATVEAGGKARITGFVSADNATPAQVWDEAYATSESAVALRYVPNSAVIHSNGAVNGSKMPDSLYTTGAPLGFDKLDGNLPGCNKYAGYVIYRFKAVQPNFTVEKTVANEGKGNWSNLVSAKKTAKVEYKIAYTNTGSVQQDNVTVIDNLPKGVSYVAGSTKLANSTTDGYEKVKSDAIVAQGINIGSYAPKGNAFVKFTAKVDAEGLKCGKSTLVNKAVISTENGSKSDTAAVQVNVECAPDECKPGIEKGDERCEDEIVTALPATGPAEIAGMFIGVVALSLAVVYWYHSRQEYKKAMLGHNGSAGSEVKLLRAHTETKAEDDDTTKW